MMGKMMTITVQLIMMMICTLDAKPLDMTGLEMIQKGIGLLIKAQDEKQDARVEKLGTYAKTIHNDLLCLIKTVRNESLNIRKGVETIKEEIDGVAAGIDGVKNGIDAVREGIDGVKVGIGGVKEGIYGVKKGVEGVKKEVEDVKKGMENATKGIRSFTEGMGKVKDAVNEQGNRLYNQSKRISDLLSPIFGLRWHGRGYLDLADVVEQSYGVSQETCLTWCFHVRRERDIHWNFVRYQPTARYCECYKNGSVFIPNSDYLLYSFH